jgi:hypothetical protein
MSHTLSRVNLAGARCVPSQWQVHRVQRRDLREKYVLITMEDDRLATVRCERQIEAEGGGHLGWFSSASALNCLEGQILSST